MCRNKGNRTDINQQIKRSVRAPLFHRCTFQSQSRIKTLESGMTFKLGDIVQLKSGGPHMTVEQIGEAAITGESTVWCVWFEKVGGRQTRHEATFRPTSLENTSMSFEITSI